MRRALALVGLVAALAGCGSTVQLRGQVPVDGLGQSGAQVAVPARTGAGTETGASPMVTSAVSVPPGAGRASTPSSVVPSAPSTLQHVPPGAPVTVGIRIPNHNAAKVVGQLTGSQLDMGDPKAMAQAMVDWVNAQGGLAGHRVRPVYYENCAALSCDPSVEDQQVCAAFTQDVRAVAVVDSTQTSVALASCLARAGTAVLGGGVAFDDDQDFQSSRGLFSPYLLPVDVAYTRLVHRLDAMHWLVPGEKLGLLAVDTPTFRRVAALTKRELASLGRSFDSEAYWSGNPSDVSGIVLRFQAAGIKRIVIVDSGSQVLLQFGPAMSGQNYYPKVTVTSADVLGTIALIESPKTLDGSAGVAWMPAVDGVPNPPPPTSSARLCAQIYQAAKVGTSGPTAGAFAAAYCDAFLFARAVYARADGASLQAVRAAVFGLGRSYVPAATFSDRFTDGRYAGAASTVDVRYDTPCSCFRYVSGQIPVG